MDIVFSSQLSRAMLRDSIPVVRNYSKFAKLSNIKIQYQLPEFSAIFGSGVRLQNTIPHTATRREQRAFCLPNGEGDYLTEMAAH
jgi:hypothetical protein